MRYLYLSALLFLFSTLLCPSAFSQYQSLEYTGLRKLEIGVNTSYIVYQGDLSPTTFGSYKRGKIGFGVHASYAVLPRLDLGLEIVSTKLDDREGHYDGWRARRDFRFSTPLTYASLLGRYYLTGRYAAADGGHERLLSLYVTAGAGMAFFNPETSWDNLDRPYFGEPRLTDGLATDSLGDYANKAFFLSAGGGVRINVGPRINFYSTMTFRQLFTDYLDGFHKSCDGGNDSFTSLTLGLSFLLGGEVNSRR